jgi:ribosomal protein S19E (S16A)
MKFGGSNKRRGVKPEHFSKGSGGHIRHIIQQFEQIGFIEKHTGEGRGRGQQQQQQQQQQQAALG